MKTQTVYVQVPVSVLPKENGYWSTNLGTMYFNGHSFISPYEHIKTDPEWWIEKQEAIVLTTKEYEERMVGFAEYVDTKRLTAGVSKSGVHVSIEEFYQAYTEELKNKA